MAEPLSRLLDHLPAVGSRDPVLDLFILAGPLVVVLVALLGRRPITEALAAAYLLGVVGYVLYRGAHRWSRGGDARPSPERRPAGSEDKN